MIFLVNWISLVVYMSLIWLIYRGLQNPSVVDVGWSFGLLLSGLIYLWPQDWSARLLVLIGLYGLWACRLGFFLWYTRILPGHVDQRYLSLSEGWKIAKPLGFFLNFQLQALLILIIACPWYFTATHALQGWTVLDGLGILLVSIGLSLESLADYQLHQFKQHPTGPVCNQGLWQYSRHPNYLGEWLIWCGFTLFSLHSWLSLIGLISPLTLYLIFTRLTGPMTEAQSLKRRGQAYHDYQQAVPFFFPRWRV